MTSEKEQPQASSLRAFITAQIFGALVAAALVQLAWPQVWQMPLAAACVQGACAAFASYKLEAPPWWLAIHLGFMPLVVGASTLPIAPGWYLAVFVLLLLVFWRTDKSRVPLYLSNTHAADAVAALLPAHPCHVIDLGCGDGGLLKRLATSRPDCEFVGIEHAPLTWLWARLRTAGLANVQVRRGDFWLQHLGLFEVAYAFLSPAAMPRLWQKARSEMRAGALLVSNSFPVPKAEAQRTLELTDGRATRLYLYQPCDSE